MSGIRFLLRAIWTLFLGVLGWLVIFGLFLTLSWHFSSSSPGLKLTGLLFSSVAAFLAIGFIISRQARIEGPGLPALFGFSLGGFSAAYILGFTLPAQVVALVAATTTSFGWQLSRRLAMGPSPSRGR